METGRADVSMFRMDCEMTNFTAHFFKVTDTEIVATGKTELYPAIDRQTAISNCLYTHRLHNGNASASSLGVVSCPSCGQIAVVKDKNQEDEIDFDPATMTLATQSDIDRIWRELWGDATVLYILGRFDTESGEYLDITQNMTNGK